MHARQRQATDYRLRLHANRGTANDLSRPSHNLAADIQSLHRTQFRVAACLLIGHAYLNKNIRTMGSLKKNQ